MRHAATVTVHNRCAIEKVAPAYQPVIAEAVAVYTALWTDRLVSVHLLGSVARGEATPLLSDIDFVGLIAGDTSPGDQQRLDELAAALARGNPIVSRVDLEVLPETDLPAFRRFVLASDSVCVHGEDRHTKTVQSIDRLALAELVTPDAVMLIDGYRQGVAAIDARDGDTSRFWSRVVGKDLLKCLRFVVLLRGGDYEQSIAGIYRQIGAYVPEASGLADLLYSLYREPTTDVDRLRRALDRAEAECPPALRTQR